MNPTIHPVARLRLDSEEFLLYPGQQFGLGRSNENDLVLLDPKVSRSHARIEWTGSGFQLCELGSINGTFVNGERVASSWLLHDGDEISIGKQLLYFEIIRVEAGGWPDTGDLAVCKQEVQVKKAACLVVSRGPDCGQEYPLWGESITIGRASREATWEIRLTDRTVSRPHARLEKRDKEYFLVDLDSANGITLNNARLGETTVLQDGDTFIIGETHLVFHNR